MNEVDRESNDDVTHDQGRLIPGAATDRVLTVIISDTHLAGGPDDPLEDHVWRGQPLVRFVDGLSDSDEGRCGEIELILNGDFLEFVQAVPEAYTAVEADLWCSEAESAFKLEAILSGHAEVFAALKRFQAAGNAVTVMAGNHDIDLYWPAVRKRLREVAGPLRFELGEEWYTRYEGRLHIAHGHQVDPANRFDSWSDPIKFGGGASRLENCDGTRFVVGFVNPMDARYPFVDNIKPFSRLVEVLRKEDKLGGWWAAAALARFLVRDGAATMGASVMHASDPQQVIRQALRSDHDFGSALLPHYREVVDASADVDAMCSALSSRQSLTAFMDACLAAGRLAELPVPHAAATLGAGHGPGGSRVAQEGSTLGLVRERMIDIVKELRKGAKERWKLGAQVVVCGHTHVPETISRGDSVYFNTGSWTRYLRPGAEEEITLARLQDAESFPYELHAVYVRPGTDEVLDAEMRLFEVG